MTAKEYLWEIKRLDTCVEQKEAEWQALYSTGLCAAPDRERVKGSTEDRMPDLVNRITELREEIDQQKAEYLDRKHTIIDQIQGLNNERHVAVLYKHYVEFKRLEEISVEMHYAYKYVSRIHGRALQEFGQVYAKEIDEHASGGTKANLSVL